MYTKSVFFFLKKGTLCEREKGTRDSCTERFMPKPAFQWACRVAVVMKNPPANSRDARDMGLTPGHGLTHSSILGLENPTGRGAWPATVRSSVKSRTQLKWLNPATQQRGGDKFATTCPFLSPASVIYTWWEITLATSLIIKKLINEGLLFQSMEDEIQAFRIKFDN